ncbi:uncharacterized protein N7511_005569 [Penicillium nucicola]|uniref:uncharacterized protein n=1 Tax=Penicillium nucicola TaxID=1850975 RepID=UPI0025454A17|nr:uncharacterized protein N7511_005569 [Penicillium nucicola]KAJ5762187.1 hypothetical protein N7511_005569 [Penicillium nucicola]
MVALKAGPDRTLGSSNDLNLLLDKTPWYRNTQLFKVDAISLSIILLSSSVGYDGSLLNGLQALNQWVVFMEHPSSVWLGFVNAIYWIGAFVSALPAPYIANRYGRKPGILIGYVFLIAGAVLQTAARNKTEFLISRLLIGLCVGWMNSSAPLLLNENAYPSHRSIVSALYMCGFYMGAVISSWVTYGARNYGSSWCWRLPSVFQLLLPLCALPGILWSPESVRWLISMDRVEEARRVIANLHAGNDENALLVNYEMAEITETIREENEAFESASYAEMLRTPGNRKRLFISATLGIFSQWSGNGVISYYLSMVLNSIGITNTDHQLLISACLQIWNLLFAIGGALSVNLFGRRKLFLLSAGIMLVSYVLVTAFSGSFATTGSTSTGVAVIPFLFIYFAGYDIAMTPLIVAYPVEIWPFRLRSRGIIVTWLTTICAMLFNTFVNPIALSAIGWRYYLVFVAVLVVFAFTVFFAYPETRGFSLEQMAIVFDGDDAAVSRNPMERALNEMDAEDSKATTAELEEL